MRLADHIAAKGVEVLSGSNFDTDPAYAWMRRSVTSLQKRIAEAKLIVADEVAQYWFQNVLVTDTPWNPVSDLPTIAPPFAHFFIEFRRPPRLEIPANKLRGVPNEHYVADMPPLVGTYFEAQKADTLPDRDLLLLRARFPGVYWVGTAVTLALVHDTMPAAVLAMWTLHLREDGSAIPAGMSEEGLPEFAAVLAETPVPPEYDRSAEEWRLWFLSMVSGVMLPCLLAICFMHSKNVTINTVPPNPKLNKGHLKRTGRPLLTYHTLDIRPMRHTLKVEGQSETDGLRRALHVCRGHFKDFREGRGLFGRVHGLWWWDEQERGSLEAGVADKDYRVRSE